MRVDGDTERQARGLGYGVFDGRGGIWQGYCAEIVHWAALLKHGV